MFPYFWQQIFMHNMATIVNYFEKVSLQRPPRNFDPSYPIVVLCLSLLTPLPFTLVMQCLHRD